MIINIKAFIFFINRNIKSLILTNVFSISQYCVTNGVYSIRCSFTIHDDMAINSFNFSKLGVVPIYSYSPYKDGYACWSNDPRIN